MARPPQDFCAAADHSRVRVAGRGRGERTLDSELGSSEVARNPLGLATNDNRPAAPSTEQRTKI
ncbi:MAG: hypothetical protein AUK47_23080 [Deltaproteobacteria bacterium CG2_30_63_29]|nr:MAG: hypothetical protein AUK47_23080 [Deltaproteobacteria bacterium CG2_30_63_29]PJB34816.1 MAG: hypothetical protein CO108_27230 [Deltaproteobacteria bacterium CG_4_9_14_3_um_filter_63_12]